MINLKDKLTVFVITCGNNPNYEACIQTLNNQSCKFNIDIIRDFSPMSVAFQQMLIRCNTEYFIQIDDDMILNNNAIEHMYKFFEGNQSPKNIVMDCYLLHDVHLSKDIYGVKIYKHKVFKNYDYNISHPSAEVEQLDRMKADGYDIRFKNKVIGEHSPHWTKEGIFERYYNLAMKFRLYRYSWMEELPKKLYNKIKQDPSDLNIHAFAGCLAGIYSDKIMNEEKDFSKKRKEYGRLQSFLEKPHQATLYVGNTCNFKCDFCSRQHNEIEQAVDMTPEITKTVLHKFPDIKGICLCFTGDTKVKLVNGTNKTFKELTTNWNIYKKPFEVYSRDKNNNIVRGTAFNPRITQQINKLIEITLDNNKTIKCTPEHLFMLKNGSYKPAKDLTYKDSLMPLYSTLKNIGQSKAKYEYITDDYSSGFTHRIFEDSKNGHVIHHKNFNSIDNTSENLILMKANEHVRLHRRSKEDIIRFSNCRDKWNDSKEGKAHLIQHNKSKEQRIKASIRLKKWKKTPEGKKQTQQWLEKIHSKESILKNNQNPINIKNRKRGAIIKIAKELINNNLKLNEKNYNLYWKNGYPKFDKILKYFTSINDVEKRCTYNHKIINKKIIILNNPINVYCMTVKNYHNFALDNGVFVKNCGFSEPLTSKNLIPILQVLKKAKKYVGVITNGSLLKRRFNEINGWYKPDYISISLNAYNAEGHEKITHTKTWDTVIEGIKMVVKSDIDCYISSVVSLDNINDVPKIIKLAKELGVKTVHLHNLLPHFSENADDSYFWNNVLQVEHKHLIDEIKKLPEAFIVQSWPVLIDKSGGRNKCQFPWYSFSVNGNGSLSICNSVLPCNKKYGNINDFVIWNAEALQEFRDKFCNKDLPHCKSCFRNFDMNF